MTENIPDVVVETAAGRVRGFWRGAPGEAGSSAAFLGIPFAQAPVGPLRFASPVPPEPWPGVRDATAYAATAQRGDPGITLIPEPSVPGDSTLNVNVFTPDPGGDGSLPVLVYIHGGGYVAGSPASPWYDGRAFNRDGVVTVTVSYRLGFDGFGWIEDAPSNRGVRDWLLALEWVRDNIGAFGGDPGRVTIAGQSAGGGAVLTLLGMPTAQHLFRGVWALSGATADVPADRAEQIGRAMAEAGGIEPTVAGFSSLSEERVLELQAAAGPGMDIEKVVADGLLLGPVIDGDLLARPTDESIAAGVGADKPLVLGATDDEFAMAASALGEHLAAASAHDVLTMLGVDPDRRDAYLAANDEVAAAGPAALAGRLITDRMFRTAVAGFARLRGDAPTWVYRYSYRSGVFGAAVHCIDVPFWFDCLDTVRERVEALTGPQPPQQLADETHAAAVALIRHGDPGWPAWSTAPGTTRVFDIPGSVVPDGYAGVAALL